MHTLKLLQNTFFINSWIWLNVVFCILFVVRVSQNIDPELTAVLKGSQLYRQCLKHKKIISMPSYTILRNCLQVLFPHKISNYGEGVP